MKKFFLSALLIGSLLACKNNTTISTSTSSLFNDDSNDSANNLISYYNAVIEYDSNASRMIDNLLNNDYNKLDEMIQAKQKTNALLTWTSFIGMNPSTNVGYGTNQINILQPEDYLDKNLSAKIKPLIEKVSQSFSETKKNYEELKKYYTNEDYKDDNWTKGSDLLGKINISSTEYYKNRDEFLRIIDTSVEEAEEKILEDHSIKEAILHAKKTLKTVDEMADLVADESTSIEAIEKTYTLLEKRLESSKSINQDKLKEQNKLEPFNSFYKAIEDIIGSIRKAKRDGEISDADYKDINYKYSYVISTYNRFVK
ncbi:conserved exported hypothetical protein [Flavobacterium sp. 9AF]|uniref:DUF3829 domain-containing protein n=1 Tax=Flavobacterium sp. 9AF TaxID=2653142 RepID=UPI0012F14135|nr:DUF3829 domain-containing protein [Flavobacterium sp. 9AF]VXB10043.1 conserved exported hypothetical protein [Flavobacterium sp. 9AF]